MNRRFGQLLVVAMTIAANSQSASTLLAGNVLVGYRQNTGEFFARRSGVFNTFQAISGRDLFIPEAINPGIIRPPFDVVSPSQLTTLKTEGVQHLEFGPVLPPGMSLDDLQLTVTVSALDHPQAAVFVFDTPLQGDVDGDNVLSGRDIGMLQDGWRHFRLLPDLNADQLHDVADVHHWVKNLANTWYGDANLDGQFDSRDLIQVFDEGRYGLRTYSQRGWHQGDWNSDGHFDSADLVLALQDGGYDQGTRAVQPVPEPSGIWSIVLGLLVIMRRRR